MDYSTLQMLLDLAFALCGLSLLAVLWWLWRLAEPRLERVDTERDE